MQRHYIAAVLIVTALGCQAQDCNPDEVAKPKVDAAAVTSQMDYVPSSARAVVRADRLDGVLKLVSTLAPKLPEATGIKATREAWNVGAGWDPFDAVQWSTWGLDSAAPAVAFNTRRGWVLVTEVSDPEVFPRWREAHTSKTAKVEQAHGFEFTTIGDTNAQIAIAKSVAFVTFPNDKFDQASFKEGVKKWVKLGKSERFANQLWYDQMNAKLKDAKLSGFIKPGQFMPDSEETGQAAVIWTRMKDQMGPVGWAAKFDVMRNEVTLEVVSKPDPKAPAFVTTLGRARGELPVVGGLVDPGVLAVVRVSADPKQVYTLVRSLMPAADRIELDTWLKDVQDVLNLDVMEDILTNLKGHAIVVVYGFNSKEFTANSNIWANIFSLEATREAVLLPIEDDERLRNVLDAVTTLSEGRLNRQAVGNSVQYAWIEEGNLTWAVIVAKEYAVFIDSTAAFDHAVTYERSARPLPKPLKDAGLDQLFEGHRSSIYVDSRALSNLLNETGNNEVAQWLSPFDTVIGWTEEDEKGGSKSTLVLGIGE